GGRLCPCVGATSVAGRGWQGGRGASPARWRKTRSAQDRSANLQHRLAVDLAAQQQLHRLRRPLPTAAPGDLRIELAGLHQSGEVRQVMADMAALRARGEADQAAVRADSAVGWEGRWLAGGGADGDQAAAKL